MGGYAQSFGGISIHALLAESDESTVDEVLTNEISIHALLAESDERADSLAHAPPQISIHALLAESDRINRNIAHSEREFLSTLSLRRATGKTHKLSKPN